jgi:hypothetical protein
MENEKEKEKKRERGGRKEEGRKGEAVRGISLGYVRDIRKISCNGRIYLSEYALC